MSTWRLCRFDIHGAKFPHYRLKSGQRARLCLGKDHVQPAAVFVLLSLAFGSAITFVMPPLRGPDEIAHFLRIYSYTRGEVLSVAKIDGRKGILSSATCMIGSSSSRPPENGSPPPRLMVPATGRLWRSTRIGTASALGQDAVFMPFAGSDGYSPAAYIPYIVGGAVARLLGLDFVDMLRLMRLLGLATLP